MPKQNENQSRVSLTKLDGNKTEKKRGAKEAEMSVK